MSRKMASAFFVTFYKYILAGKAMIKKSLWLAMGWFWLVLAFVGAFLPLLPTVPFLLLALPCFAKSSPRMQYWIYHNPHFGALLRDYQAGLGIPKSAKFKAIAMIGVSMSISAYFLLSIHWAGSLCLILMALGISLWLWSRPTAPSRF